MASEECGPRDQVWDKPMIISICDHFLSTFCPLFVHFIGKSMGEITIELYWMEAPKTCKNFAELSRRGYYNGVIFHRIIPNFMIQGLDQFKW